MSGQTTLSWELHEKARRVFSGEGSYAIVPSPVGYGPPPWYCVQRLDLNARSADQTPVAFSQASNPEELVLILEACEMLKRREIGEREARDLLS
jgi:hypothetical protein